MKKHYSFFILSLFIFVVSGTSYSQVYNMPANGDNDISTTETVCQGNFYDDGGLASNYSNGSGAFLGSGTTRQITFLPSVPGTRVRVTFTSFNLDDGSLFVVADELTVSNSDNNGTFTGTSSPGVVTSTAADGSLVFSFFCGSDDNATGWEATIELVGPTLSFPGTYCASGTLNPNWINGGPLTGGAYGALPAGIVINPATGVIDLGASTPGNYNIGYQQDCYVTGTTITIGAAITQTVSASICQGGSYSFGSQTLTASGQYTETFTSVSGCDSTVTLNLNVTVPGTFPASQQICQGQSYTFGPQVLTQAGTYTQQFTTVAGCDSTVVLTLTIGNCGVPEATVGIQSAQICEGECINFVDGSTFTPTSWAWTFEGTSITSSTDKNPGVLCFPDAGTYEVSLTVTNQYGTDQTTITITVGTYPEITAFGDTTIDMGGVAILGAEGTGGIITWVPDENVSCKTIPCDSVHVNPLIPTYYFAQITSPDGCMTEDTVFVNVRFKDVIDLPSAFSPNNDGVNDFLLVKGVGIVRIHLMIYNRYGALVFETTNLAEGWDGTFEGKELNSSTFAYVLEYDLIDGSSNVKKGSVSLIH